MSVLLIPLYTAAVVRELRLQPLEVLFVFGREALRIHLAGCGGLFGSCGVVEDLLSLAQRIGVSSALYRGFRGLLVASRFRTRLFRLLIA